MLADVTVRPVCGPLPCVEKLDVKLEVLWLRKLRGCYADILNMANTVALRESSVVHGARVPAQN